MSSLPNRLGAGRTPAKVTLAAVLAFGVGALSACSAPTESEEGEQVSESATVTLTNCGEEVEFPSPAQRMFVNDSNIISIALAAGASENIAAISRADGANVLEAEYGEEFTSLEQVSPDYPSLETVLSANPDVMFAGWSYGFSDEENLTPESLAEHAIAGYVLSESCRTDAGTRGTMDPWEALETDLNNVAAIGGDVGRAEETIDDINNRREALEQAPQPDEEPTIFLFDSGSETVYTSGSFGAPQAIIEAAGARNATEGIDDTWTAVNWEEIAAAQPEAFVFVDYPPETLEQKIETLKANPVTQNMPAVQEERFINLPYSLWTSGPLNIDAAEILRKGLEAHELVPASDIEPGLTVETLGVDGNEWAR